MVKCTCIIFIIIFVLDGVPTFPVITESPKAVSKVYGERVNFSITITEPGDCIFYWIKDGEAINGANSLTYNIGSVTSEHVGNYKCVVSNEAGSVESQVAKLSGVLISFVVVNSFFMLSFLFCSLQKQICSGVNP